jgi:hypothetical protein
MYGYTAWNITAERDNLQALETLWICVKEAGLNMDELFRTQNKQGYTARPLATGGHLFLLEKLGVWEEEAQLIPQLCIVQFEFRLVRQE